MACISRRTEAMAAELAPFMAAKRQRSSAIRFQRRLSLIPEELPQQIEASQSQQEKCRVPSVVQNMFGLCEWDEGQNEVDLSALRRISRPDLQQQQQQQQQQRRAEQITFTTPNYLKPSPPSTSLAALVEWPRKETASTAESELLASLPPNCSWGVGYMASMMGPLGWEEEVPELTPDVECEEPTFINVVVDAEPLPIQLAHAKLVLPAQRQAPKAPRLRTCNIPSIPATPVSSPIAAF